MFRNVPHFGWEVSPGYGTRLALSHRHVRTTLRMAPEVPRTRQIPRRLVVAGLGCDVLRRHVHGLRGTCACGVASARGIGAESGGTPGETPAPAGGPARGRRSFSHHPVGGFRRR